VVIVRSLEIRGRVQGVGFRYALRAEARRLALTGWVRNRLDGSVEAVVQGPDEAVEKLVEWARRGPPSARVTDLKVTSAEGSFEAFEVRPTA
jgi:acylphosphatase